MARIGELDYGPLALLAAAQLDVKGLSKTGVTAATYGDSTHVPAFVVNADGVITSASNVAISGAVAPPGGTSGQVQYNNAGAFGGFTVGGDGTLNTATGALVVTKSNGTSFGTAAFVNTGTSGATVPLLNGTNTYSGTQVYGTSAAAISIFYNGPAGSIRGFNFLTAGSGRWLFSTDNTAESGSSTGSNFTLTRYDNSGVFIDVPFIILRSTGQATFTLAPKVGAATLLLNSDSANPTASVGPSAVNGTALTFMRSDAAPALANTAVTPGSYTSTNLTVDAQGRITAAANGSVVAPGGTSGQVQYNNAGAFGGLTVGGDGTLNAGTGALTVTKSSGVAFGTAAFVDTGASGHALVFADGNNTFSGTVGIGADTSITGTISPAALVADVNNYAPTGFATATLINISASGAFRTITGLAGGVNGKTVVLFNSDYAAFAINLASENASSTAANRFSFIATYLLYPGNAVILRYDGSASRWKPILMPLQASASLNDVPNIVTARRALLVDYLEATQTYDPASILNGAVGATQTITVTGVVLGGLVTLSFSLDMQGMDYKAWVSAANTVKYAFINNSGGTLDLGSGTVRVRVWT